MLSRNSCIPRTSCWWLKSYECLKKYQKVISRSLIARILSNCMGLCRIFRIMWDCAEKMKLCDSASAHNSVGPVHGNTELSFARYLLRFGGGKCFSLWSISVINLVLNVIIGFSIAEYSVGVGRCWRPVKNGEGRVSLKYKHMQCTCVRCYNFYHPPPPSIYASLTLLSKTRLPYPSIHLSMPVPPLVQVSAALSIHPLIHPTIPP